jgi:hypothetical protein
MAYVIRQGRRIEVETVAPNVVAIKKGKTTEPFARVPLAWAARAIKATRDPAALVWIELLYAAWKADGKPFGLSNARLQRAGVSRDVKYRVLRDLERAGMIAIAWSPGRAPVITLLT